MISFELMHLGGKVSSATSNSLIRILLIVLELFLAVGAFFGSGMMLASPEGSAMALPSDMLEGSGFRSFFIPGLILGVVNGVFPVVVAVAAMRRQSWVRYGHFMVGCLLTGWIAIQGVLIGFGHWLQIFYLALGLFIAAFGWIELRRDR